MTPARPRARERESARERERWVALSHSRTLALSALVVWSLILAGCGYALVGRANFLPEGIKTIQVPSFVNRTTRVELEQRVTQAVAEEIVSRGRLTLVSGPSEAHVILRGSIESFGLTPVAFNEEGRATRYQVTVAARIELVDHRNEDAVLWKNDQYLFTETYSINLQLADAFDQETRAIQEIADRFAESVVTNLLEGF
jgi:outer membrane lipopolysaccharide assembly protein LptE/RlpB